MMHVANHATCYAFTCSDTTDRLARKIRCTISSHEKQRATTGGDEATFEEMKRVRDQTRVQNVTNCYRIAMARTRIFACPLALHDSHHRQLLRRHAVLLHVPQDRQRKECRRTDRTIRGLELARQTGAAAKASKVAATNMRTPTFAVCNQHGLTQAVLNGGNGVAYVQHERTSANRCPVDPLRRDSKVMSNG